VIERHPKTMLFTQIRHCLVEGIDFRAPSCLDVLQHAASVVRRGFEDLP
jgi:hypothetical protein